jgi:hypothetical protein
MFTGMKNTGGPKAAVREVRCYGVGAVTMRGSTVEL